MFDKHKKKVIVGMSGGVDSSVAAWLMQKQGYQVEGLFMKNWEEDDDKNNCNASNDLADAQSVCNKLNIHLHKINFAAEYWEKVFKNFLEEYKIGRTPNPDVLCNKEIKFKAFLEFAIDDLGADFITTGHYVRKQYINGKYFLLRSFDYNKDQSYFLYTLNSQQISKSLFPIGNFRKSEVRSIAKKLHLITAKKKDSTGICFIGKRNFCDFLKRYLPSQIGNIENLSGEIIGKHQGVIYYTLGQRKGLNIGGCKNGNGKPWYVIDKDMINNRLIVAQGDNHPKLLSIGLIAQKLHWINNQLITSNLRCTVKTRYRQADIPCEIIQTSDKHIEVRFDFPIAAVTPGQSAVFYLGEICLGGGIIEQRLVHD